MNLHVRSQNEIAGLLRSTANRTESFMRTPTRWEFPEEPFCIDLDPDLLGGRLLIVISDGLKSIRAKCLVAGLGDVSDSISAASKAAVDYLDALSDFINQRFGALPRDIVPSVESLDYSHGRKTPVDDLAALLHELASELASPDCVVTREELAASVGCSEDTIRIALRQCPSVTEGTKGQRKVWKYSQAVDYLKRSTSPGIRDFQWPEIWHEHQKSDSRKISERK
jgi:hypothetical protein